MSHKHKEEKKEFNRINGQGQFGSNVEPRKSFQSFLRNSTKIHINAVSILDKKGAVLIRINTTLISAIVVFGNYIKANVLYGEYISIILLIGLASSLLLAILAEKPSVKCLFWRTFSTKIMPHHPELEKSLFMNKDVTRDYQEYEMAVQKIIHSQDLQIGNQIRAMYALSVHNDYKAGLLDKAYNIFILTFTAVSFIAVISRLM